MKNQKSSLSKTQKMKNDNPILGYDVSGKPITAKEITEMAEVSVEQVKMGNFIRHEDLMKEVGLYPANS